MSGRYKRCAKGRYAVVNKHKYIGDVDNVIFRSGLERKLLRYLDLHDDVLNFASEEVVIPYISPIDGRPHRYFVDFFVRIRRKDGRIDNLLIEVKPSAQCSEPERKNSRSKRYLEEVMTWGVNSAKWKAAESYCKTKGWSFVILTERELR